jgi:hypothetical protein
MQDSDQEYPLKQPRHQHAFDGFKGDQDDGSDRESDREAIIQPVEPHKAQHAPVHQREKPDRPQLPRGHLKTTLIIALVAGMLASAQVIVVTLFNGAIYRESAKYASNPSNLSLATAFAIFGLFCLTSVIGLVIYLIAGFVTGKIAVDRRMGFLGGFVAGVIAQVIGYIVQQFPGYPAAVNSGVNGGLVGISGSVIFAVVLLLVVALIAGLVGLLGAWLATRRHPYYAGYNA